MKTKNMDNQDKKIRELLSGTKMNASENLKFRIMHQIEAENALSRKKIKSAKPIISNTFIIFGVMYFFIALMALGLYLVSGTTTIFTSPIFYIAVILVGSACSMFWLISTYDDKRRSNQRERK